MISSTTLTTNAYLNLTEKLAILKIYDGGHDADETAQYFEIDRTVDTKILESRGVLERIQTRANSKRNVAGWISFLRRSGVYNYF